MFHIQKLLALWSLEATVWKKTKNLHQRSPPRHSLAYYRHQLLSSLAVWNYGSWNVWKQPSLFVMYACMPICFSFQIFGFRECPSYEQVFSHMLKYSMMKVRCACTDLRRCYCSRTDDWTDQHLQTKQVLQQNKRKNTLLCCFSTIHIV